MFIMYSIHSSLLNSADINLNVFKATYDDWGILEKLLNRMVI